MAGVASRGLLVAVIACLGALGQAAEARASRYSSHSQLYSCCTGAAVKEAMFREARASGAEFIRVDVAMEAVLPQFGARRRDWSGLDSVAALSDRHGLKVLAVLQGTPRQMAVCTDVTWWESRVCPPADPERWARAAGQIAARYRGRIDHFQVWNEPDGQWAFRGTAEDYGRLLAASAPAIHENSPGATVVLGGLMQPGAEGRGWLDRALAAGGPAAAGFDVAAFHYRGPLPGISPTVLDWRAYLAARGLSSRLWVTEHAYPGAPEWQFEPGLTGGEYHQAGYLWSSLPTFIAAGTEQVFVTLHDGGGGPFDSEGILAGTAQPGGAFRRRPAFYAVLHAPLSPPAGAASPASVKPKELRARRCAIRRAGGPRADRLRGTAAGERLLGRGGPDVLQGRGGDDCLVGGPGRDRLEGGSGRDVLKGGPGKDFIHAVDGVAETVRCGPGRDRVRADATDRLRGCERVRREFASGG